MKTARMMMTVAAAVLGLNQAQAAHSIEGVWELRTFEIVENGQMRPWCEGAFGSIVYFRGTVFAAINCTSDPQRKVFYTGPYERRPGEVVHQIRNAADESLIGKTLVRKVRMSGQNSLELVGPFGTAGIVRLTWVRRERIAVNEDPFFGVYQLTGSHNQFEGRSDVPYCTGVFGTILYTPGGFTAVALNCAPKADPSQAEPADAHGRSYFYFGSFGLGKAHVSAELENASVVEQIGERVERSMELRDGELTLAGMNGSAFVAVWRRVMHP